MSKHIHNEKFAEVLQLAQDTHLTTKEISEKTGVGYELTRQWLKKAGLPTKRPWGYEKREAIRNCEKSWGWQTRIAKELGISQQLVSKYYFQILLMMQKRTRFNLALLIVLLHSFFLPM